jgi:hypothetical protein
MVAAACLPATDKRKTIKRYASKTTNQFNYTYRDCYRSRILQVDILFLDKHNDRRGAL